MSYDPTGGVGDLDFLRWLHQTNPQAAERISGLGTMDERAGVMDEQGAQIQQQMALAQALANRRGPQRHTALGAAFQGLGDVASNFVGGQRLGESEAELAQLMAQKRGLLDQKDARRMEYQKALSGYLGTPQLLLRPPDDGAKDW